MRSIAEINKLPISELTDEEIAKAAMYRMDAKAAMLVYLDKNNEPYFVSGHKNGMGRAFIQQLLSIFKRNFRNVQLTHEKI